MTAFNVVRFRVKPGHEQAFVAAHRNANAGFKGWRNGALVKTGDQTFCLVGEWNSFNDIVAARPQMIGLLDNVREMLEDLGGGLGVTDPVSGETVAELRAPARAKGKAKKKAKPAAKKKAARKPAKKKSRGRRR